LAEHRQTRHTIRDDIDLIPFRGEKPPQNLPQSTIVFDDQNPLHYRRSEFGDWSVQACCHGSGCHELFLFLRDRA
jgi:hypothetical protein